MLAAGRFCSPDAERAVSPLCPPSWWEAVPAAVLPGSGPALRAASPCWTSVSPAQGCMLLTRGSRGGGLLFTCTLNGQHLPSTRSAGGSAITEEQQDTRTLSFAGLAGAGVPCHRVGKTGSLKASWVARSVSDATMAQLWRATQ